MDKPKPKFCVGEEVAVVGAFNPENNINRTEVVKVCWTKFSHDSDPEWGYKTANLDKDHWAFEESALRKLPPEDRTQWSDCEWMPQETVK